MNLIDAQQSRRVLDRLVGYKLSPLLWKKIRMGLSAGRVQSAAVRLVVERDDQRKDFKQEEYWNIKIYLDNKKIAKKININILKNDKKREEAEKPEGVEFLLTKINGKKTTIENEKNCKNLIDKITKGDYKIDDKVVKNISKHPGPAFTTSFLQQTASYKLGFSAKKTMTVAQKLYEAGKITYMRTDSTNLSEVAISDIRNYIKKEIGENYLSEKINLYKTKSKVAQEAHEAIRPVKISLSPEKSDLEGDFLKLYKLIWSKTVATQMKDAQIEALKYISNSDEFEFSATGQRVVFPGYLKIFQEKIAENLLPDLSVEQKMNLLSVSGIQSFTQPPARYTEATLIKVLESYGIGRPSTYVPIITTILARGYVTKDGKYFEPTEIAHIVIRFLKDHFADIVDYKFTAEIEDDLDKIANGEIQWIDEINKFYKPFEKNLIKKEKVIKREDYTTLG